MYSLVKPLYIRQELLKRKISIFTKQEFSHIFNLSPYQSEYSLRELTKEGLLTRLKRGVYILKTDPPSEEQIANALYKPSYISFEYALAYYNILPEMIYQITSATTKPTRLFEIGPTSFAYYAIKKAAYTGYTLAQRRERRFYMAEPEKAFVDYLYITSLGKRSLLGGKSLSDRMELKSLNEDKIYFFVGMYGWSKLNKLVRELL